MKTIKQTLSEAVSCLANKSSSPRIDAEVLLAHILTASRTFLYTHPEKHLEPTQLEEFQQLLTKRSQGVPIAYLTTDREFWSLPLSVSEQTLIPRPETELLVELTLKLLKNIPHASIIELGTGSGAVALALASVEKNWQILACDVSEEAITVARHNAHKLGVTNLKLVCSDWFSALPAMPVHAIVSNPPYIAENDPHLNEGDLRFEPKLALVSGNDGLEALTHLIHHSYEYLLPGGLLLLEHGFSQKPAVTTLLQERGYNNIHCWQDSQGLDRVSGGWR